MSTCSALLRGFAAVAGVAALLFGCTAPQRPVPPPPPSIPTPGIYYEESLPDSGRPRIEIVGLSETPSPDNRRVTLTGTLINRGNKATSELSVRVDALDESGQVVLSLSAVPASQRLAAAGGTTTFATTIDNRPDVRRYHVEAIAK